MLKLQRIICMTVTATFCIQTTVKAGFVVYYICIGVVCAA